MSLAQPVDVQSHAQTCNPSAVGRGKANSAVQGRGGLLAD